MITVESLGIDFFFNGISDVQKAEKAKEVINALLSGFGRLAGAAGGVYKVGDSIRDFIVKAVDLDNVARASNDTVESLHAWSEAIEAVGGDADTFLSTVGQIGDALTASDFEDSQFRRALVQMGVSWKNLNGTGKTVTEVLKGIANSAYWQRLSEPQQMMLGRRMGLDDDTIRLLQRGGEELDKALERQEQLGTITKKQAELAREIRDAYNELIQTWRAVSREISVSLLPYVKDLVYGLRDLSNWVFANKPILYGLIFGVSALLGYILLPVLAKIALAWVVAFAPVLAILGLLSALGAALYYVYQDYVKWKEGGESAFADIWQKWDRTIQAIITSLESFSNSVRVIWNEIKTAWTEALDYIQTKWKGLTLGEIGADIGSKLKIKIDEAWTDLDNSLKKGSISRQARTYGENVGDIIVGIARGAQKSFTNYLDEGDILGSVLAVARGIVRAFKTVQTVIETVIKAIWNFVQGVFKKIQDGIEGFAKELAKAIIFHLVNLPGDIKEWIYGPEVPTGIDTSEAAADIFAKPTAPAGPRKFPLPPGFGASTATPPTGGETNQNLTIGSVSIISRAKDFSGTIDEAANEIGKRSSAFFSAESGTN